MCSMLPPAVISDLALAALLEAQQDLVLDLQVPGEVVFAGLQHGARRRDRVAAALHLDRVEIGPVRHVVVRD